MSAWPRKKRLIFQASASLFILSVVLRKVEMKGVKIFETLRLPYAKTGLQAVFIINCKVLNT